MAPVESAGPPRFYFAAPRLLAKAAGGSAARTEQNWLEANVVGLAIFAISYLTFASLLPTGWPWWAQGLALFALAIATWLFWALATYLGAVVIRLLRGFGLLRALPSNRAQSVLIGMLTTGFAWRFLGHSDWLRVIGLVWIVAVCCNLLAAIVLALIDADPPATK